MLVEIVRGKIRITVARVGGWMGRREAENNQSRKSFLDIMMSRTNKENDKLA